MTDVISTNYDALIAAVWELQFEDLSHAERCERLGLPDGEYRRLRGEALTSFEPTAKHIYRICAPKST